MKKEKKNSPTEPGKAIIDHYSRYKNAQMVHIAGNFYRGGFNLSKKKVAAVLDNREELQKFVNGNYDSEIAELADDEILRPE